MSARWYLFPAPVVFKVSGKDARRYLNNRLSNDLRSAPPGTTLRAGALSPQGRVEGLYTVFVEADDLFYLVCDGGDRQPLFAALGRYIVADRVSIVDCSSEVAFAHTTATSSEISQCVGERRVSVAPRSRIADQGSDLLALNTPPVALAQELERVWGAPLSRESYDLARFAHGSVEFPLEVNSSVVLTEVGLRDSVSFTKGCYVGQEVIERSDAIGKLPRTLERAVFIGGTGVVPEAPVLKGDGQYVGKVLSVINDSEQGRALAFVLLKSGAYSSADALECGGCRGSLEPRLL
jgi:folate-binding protein YgfZ